ncbi:MAG: PilN domain-containing protein [Blastocatellia bacterium]
MIRVNLLEGTAEQRVALQKTKVAARRGQQIFMLLAAMAIFGVAMGIDFLLTNSAHAQAKADLEREQQEEKKLKTDLDRKTDLENQLKQVEERIKIIKQLRAEQKGPVAMLSSINERLPGGTVEFELEKITQKGNHLMIVGSATNQQTVSDFANRLEFSGGMFTGLFLSHIEGRDFKPEGDKSKEDETARMFKFTIDCDYNKPHDASADDSAAGASPKPAVSPTK